MLSGGAQLVGDHPWVLHEFGQIENTTVRPEARRDATRHPMVDGIGAEEGFERPLQLCSLSGRDFGQAV
jgi:hypothetical protein